MHFEIIGTLPAMATLDILDFYILHFRLSFVFIHVRFIIKQVGK